MSDSLFPLSEFYARTSLALPAITRIQPAEMPEPYRSLLVHSNDMTPTLERHHASEIYIRALSTERRGTDYFREVVLHRASDDAAIEFGANCIHLERFSPEARWMILQEKVPLGQILREHNIPHATQALDFFRVEPDETICRALHLPAPVSLYGRRALLSDAEDQPLSQVVEILPLASLVAAR
jgi:chorismate-pyruvate lyase